MRNYKATKQWRQDHPEEARRMAREWAERRRRRLGLPVRGPRGSYIDKPESEAELKIKRDKMTEIIEAAKKSKHELRLKK